MTRLRGALPLLALLVPSCRDAGGTLTLAGTIEIREARLAPLAAGRLTRLLKDEGDTVRVGDTVAVLEQPGLSELIAQRRAQAEAAAARTAEITAALADSARAANDLARARRLRQDDAISPQQVEALENVAAAAAARVQGARAALRDAEAARAALATAQATRDQLTLVSPAAGIVLTRYAEPGETIGVGQPIVAIGLVDRPWVRAYVGERLIARVHVGQEARVRVDGYPDTAFAGRVSEIAPRAEFTPRAALTERERADLVFGIKIAIDAAGGRLKAGMPVEVDLPLSP